MTKIADKTGRKTLDYYMALPYVTIIKPAEEGGFVAMIKELPGCLTQGETREEALSMVEDAKKSWILVALEDGDNIPEPERDQEYSGKFNVRIPKSLHKDLANKAKVENVSLNQLTTYLLSIGMGRKMKAEK